MLVQLNNIKGFPVWINPDNVTRLEQAAHIEQVVTIDETGLVASTKMVRFPIAGVTVVFLVPQAEDQYNTIYVEGSANQVAFWLNGGNQCKN